jgi:sulfite exporter TauE/SafE
MGPLAIELTAPALFIAGATTSLHCALMCGAINAAQVRSRGPVPLHQALALVHGARVAGYALLGALAGALGGRLALWLPGAFAGQGLQVLAGITLIGAGLQQLRGHRLGGHPAGCPGRGSPIARGPAGLRLAAQGFAWALMPCGILYTVLLLAALTTDALAGFVLLAAFGLGTLPLMGVSGGLFGLATRPQDTRPLRRFAATALILLGGVSVSVALLDPAWLPPILCEPRIPA